MIIKTTLALALSISFTTHAYQGMHDSMDEVNTDSKEVNSSCGRISIVKKPLGSQNYYPAIIHKVNDDHRKKNRNAFRLSPGTHTIEVKERIESSGFPIRRNNKAKSIVIKVEEGKTYHIGSEYNSEYRLSGGEKYWQPIVWRVTEQVCSL